MDSTLMLVLGLAGITIGIVLVFAVLGTFSTERAGVGRSLAAIEALEAADPDMRARELDRPFGERVVAPSYQRLSDLGRRLTPAGASDRLRRRLDLAGNPEGWSVDRVLAWKIIGLVAGLLLGFVVPLLFDLSAIVRLLILVAVGVLGFFVPNIVLYDRGTKRSEQIRRELADSIDLLTISVEAGLAFDGALAQVARNTKGPLAEEFFRVLSEMQIGRSRSDAFRGLAERSDVDELRQFVTALVQADAFGIPIAEVLRVQSKELRIKRRQHAEEQAQKIPIKIIFPLVLFILPAIFVVLIGPALLTIFDTLGNLS